MLILKAYYFLITNVFEASKLILWYLSISVGNFCLNIVIYLLTWEKHYNTYETDLTDQKYFRTTKFTK